MGIRVRGLGSVSAPTDIRVRVRGLGSVSAPTDIRPKTFRPSLERRYLVFDKGVASLAGRRGI